jgi:hypothetical protein
MHCSGSPRSIVDARKSTLRPAHRMELADTSRVLEVEGSAAREIARSTRPGSCDGLFVQIEIALFESDGDRVCPVIGAKLCHYISNVRFHCVSTD